MPRAYRGVSIGSILVFERCLAAPPSGTWKSRGAVNHAPKGDPLKLTAPKKMTLSRETLGTLTDSEMKEGCRRRLLRPLHHLFVRLLPLSPAAS